MRGSRMMDISTSLPGMLRRPRAQPVGMPIRVLMATARAAMIRVFLVISGIPATSTAQRYQSRVKVGGNHLRPNQSLPTDFARIMAKGLMTYRKKLRRKV